MKKIKKSALFILIFVLLNYVNIYAKSYKNDDVNYEIKDNIGYLKIHYFSNETKEKLIEFNKMMDKEQIKKIIIDLRNNIGGDLYGAIEAAKVYTKKGVICSVYIKDSEKVIYESDNENNKYQIIGIVNIFTASSAELFASSLQESGSAKLLGTQTYGKNSIQQIKIVDRILNRNTIGYYLTRNNKDISGIGLEPDYLFENKDDYDFLDEAFKILKGE